MEDQYLKSSNPVQIDTPVLVLPDNTLSFNISIRRLVETHKDLFIALATDWGAAGANLTITPTVVASLTTGDIDINLAFAPTA